MTETKVLSGSRDDAQPRLKAFTLLTCIVCVTILSAFISVNMLQANRHTAESLSLCSLVSLKQKAAIEKGTNKILMIGGSGVSLGLNAALLEEELGRPVANFGLQASLGVEIILTEAKKVLRPGDTALLVFEYPLFHLKQISSVAQEWLLDCGYESLREKTWLGQLAFYLSVSPLRWLNIFATDDSSGQGIHNEMMSRFDNSGDRVLDRHTWADIGKRKQERINLYQPEHIHIADEALGPAHIKAFAEWAAGHDISVVASWPNTISFPQYMDNSGFQKIADFYRDIDVAVIGKPELALLDIAHFHDTQYHLTAGGILKRSEVFKQALKEHCRLVEIGQSDSRTCLISGRSHLVGRVDSASKGVVSNAATTRRP